MPKKRHVKPVVAELLPLAIAGATYAQMAKHLAEQHGRKVSPQRVFVLLDEELTRQDEEVRQLAKKYRALELQRLDGTWAKLWAAYSRLRPQRPRGAALDTTDDGTWRYDEEALLRLASGLVRVSARRSRLLGLDLAKDEPPPAPAGPVLNFFDIDIAELPPDKLRQLEEVLSYAEPPVAAIPAPGHGADE